MADEINNLTEDQLWDMSDEELEAQVNAIEGETDDLQEEEQTPEEEIEHTEEVEDLEQPVGQDSDDNASDEIEDEVETEEPSDEVEVDNETADETKTEDEQVTEEEATPEVKPQPTQTLKVKANGREFEFTPEEVLERFPQVFGQAMDYTRKTQAIKPWRKQIDALEQNKITPDDLNLMIDVLKGNKEAVTEVLKRTGIDALELETDEATNYVPEDYGRDEIQLDLQEVITDISSDPEYERTNKVLSNEWDDASWNELSATPTMIKALHEDVKSGMYDTLMPTVGKLKLYDGGRKSDIEYYKEAATMYYSNLEQVKMQEAAQRAAQDAEAKLQQVRQAQTSAEVERAKAPKRKAATPVSKAAPQRKAVDYLDDSEEAFEEWYNKIQDSY